MPALIFDCDGVLADTERDGHRPAFNETFAEVGLPVRWSEEEYAEKLKIGGGKERMASLLTAEFVRGQRPARRSRGPEGAAGRLAQAQDRASTRRWSRAGRLPGRARASPGSSRRRSAPGWTLAVASTSAEESVRAVLEHAVGADAAARFAVFAGDIVPAKKPDPAIYTLALERLGVEPRRGGRDRGLAQRPAGGASAPGLRCVVTVSGYTADEDMSEAVLVVTSLGDPGRASAGARQPRRRAARRLVTLDDLEAVPDPTRYPRRRLYERAQR